MPEMEVFGHIYRVGQDPSDSKSNRLVYMLTSSSFDAFLHLRYILYIDSSKMIGHSLEVSNFNRLFLKLNMFICN